MKFIESGHFDCQFVGGSVFVGILQLTAGFLLTVCWLVLPDESPGLNLGVQDLEYLKCDCKIIDSLPKPYLLFPRFRSVLYSTLHMIDQIMLIKNIV